MMPVVASNASGAAVTTAGGRGRGGCEPAEAGPCGGFPAALLAVTGAVGQPEVDTTPVEGTPSADAGVPATDRASAELEGADAESDALNAVAVLLAGAAGLFLPPATVLSGDNAPPFAPDGELREGEAETVHVTAGGAEAAATSRVSLDVSAGTESGPVLGAAAPVSDDGPARQATDPVRLPSTPAVSADDHASANPVVVQGGTRASPEEASDARMGHAVDSQGAVVAQVGPPPDTLSISPELESRRPTVNEAARRQTSDAAKSAGVEPPASETSRTPRSMTVGPVAPTAVSSTQADRGLAVYPDATERPGTPGPAARLAEPIRRAHAVANPPASLPERGDPANTLSADRSTAARMIPFSTAGETVAPDAGRDRRTPDAPARDLARGTERLDAAPAARSAGAPLVRDVVAPRHEPPTTLNIDRLVAAARVSVARGGMEVRLRLHPEALGEVQVEVRWESGVLSARLEAATPAAREALEGGAQALRTLLQEQGIPVERLSVGLRMDLHARSQERSTPSPSERSGEPAATLVPPAEPERTAEPAAAGRLDVRI